MQIENIRHDFPKSAGYILNRPQGRNYYVFAHYYSAVSLRIGEKTYMTEPGACVLIEPNMAQYLCSEEALVHNWLHIYLQEDTPWLKEIPLNEPFYIVHSERISDMFRKIEREFLSSEPYREMMLEAQVNSFFVWLLRQMRSPAEPVSVLKAVRTAVTQVRKQVLACPEKNWSIALMAQMAHLSTSRFHAVYKAMFGTTPAQDMIDARVDHAKTLQRSQPELSMKELAEELGYNDQYHFIRQFRGVTGTTPSKYRNQKP